MTYRLPDLDADKLTAIIAALNTTAALAGETALSDLATWLLEHAWQPQVPPDIARILKLCATRNSEGQGDHLRFTKVAPITDGEAEIKSWRIDPRTDHPPM